MKTRFTLLALLVTPFAVFAQATAPQLTSANTAPVPGTRIATFAAGFFSPGSAGANQTWDYASLSYVSDTATVYSGCSATGNNCTPYAGANLVGLVQADGDTTRQYFRSVTTAYSIVGNASVLDLGGGTPLKFTATYTKQRDILRFPMNFNSQFTNSWRYTATFNGLPAQKTTGYDTVKADAWGTIKTPAGTFVALRVKTQTAEYDTTSFGGQQSVDTTYTTTYSWYDALNKDIIFRGEISQDAGGVAFSSATYVKVVPTSINPLAGTAFNWKVAPNPATGNRIQVQIESAASTPVSLRLVDLMGRQVRTLPAQTASNGNLVLETGGLPAGTYILAVLANGQMLGQQCVTIDP